MKNIINKLIPYLEVKKQAKEIMELKLKINELENKIIKIKKRTKQIVIDINEELEEKERKLAQSEEARESLKDIIRKLNKEIIDIKLKNSENSNSSNKNLTNEEDENEDDGKEGKGKTKVKNKISKILEVKEKLKL